MAKIHGLTDLYTKYPAKFAFDVALFEDSSVDGGTLKFVSPPTAHDRLVSLKPYLSAEVYEAYVEIFSIFRSIALAVGHTDAVGGNVLGKQPVRSMSPELAKRDKQIAPLTQLAAHKLGKSMVSGTKSTYYMLNQTLLFDQASIPPHLQIYQNQLADSIEDWLTMEPAGVLATHRSDLVWGYVLHVLVFNSHSLLFTLVPVLVHWLHEQGSPSSTNLFMEYWLFSSFDSDREELRGLTDDLKTSRATLETFWLFARTNYWRSLIRLLKVSSPFVSPSNFEPYDALMLDTLARTDKLHLDFVKVENVYEILAKNAQYPQNTAILISVVAQSIVKVRKQYRKQKTSSAAYAVLHSVYHQIRLLARTWLCLSTGCVFNSLDKGNEELFDGVFVLLHFLRQKCHDVLSYLKRYSAGRVEEIYSRFTYLEYNVKQTVASLRILRAFYLDVELVEFDMDSAVGEHFSELMADKCESDMVEVFASWLQDTFARDLREYLWDMIE